MMNQISKCARSCIALTMATTTPAMSDTVPGSAKTTATRLATLLATLLAFQSASEAAFVIDIDLVTPGIQHLNFNVTEGQTINFALVATDFTGDIHCANGIGGDISSKGTMSVAFGPIIRAGEIAGFTDNGPFISNITDSQDSFIGVPVIETDPLTSHNLAPLLGYTDNLGGVGMRDIESNLDIDNHVISFTNVPGGSVPYVTIFTASMTLTNVSGTTLDLFPSGVFDNPPTTPGPNSSVALFPGGQPFSFLQSGDIMLHTEAHDFDDECWGGPGSLAGATLAGVPEPSTIILLACSAFGSLSRRSRH